MWVDVHLPAPFHHALEDGHQALQALDAHAPLLQGRGSQLQGAPALGQLGQVVDQSLKDVGRGCTRAAQSTILCLGMLVNIRTYRDMNPGIAFIQAVILI